MLCSQNEDLYFASEDGVVAEVERLLSLGGDVNNHEGEVSCVSLCGNRCVILTTSVLTLQSVTEHSALYSVVLITIGIHVYSQDLHVYLYMYVCWYSNTVDPH